MSAPQELLDKAHVHGLSGLVLLNGVFKVFWIFCVIGTFTGCYIHCWNLVNDAKSEQIQTYVENYQEENGFPIINICPTHLKYDDAKVANKINVVKKLIIHDLFDQYTSEKFAERMLMYLSSLETLGYVKRKRCVSVRRNARNGQQNKWDTTMRTRVVTIHSAIIAQHWDDWKPWRDLIWDGFIGNQSYTDVEMELTLDFDAVVVQVEGFPLVKKHKIMTSYGICYAFEVNNSIPLTLKNVYSVQFALRRDTATTYSDYRRAPFFVYNADLMIVGKLGFMAQSPWESIYQSLSEVPGTEDQAEARESGTTGAWVVPIKTEYAYDMLISSITFNRVNRRSQPCRAWSEQDQSICMVQCLNDEFCSKMPKPCLLFHSNQTKEMQYKRLCSLLDDDQIFYLTRNTSHCALQQEIIEGKGDVNGLCRSRCPVRCVEQVYYVTHSRANRLGVYSPEHGEYNAVKWANVTLRYQDFNRRLLVHERLSWRGDTFAATFASAMSLWTGVSGLAFAQVSITLVHLVSQIFDPKRMQPQMILPTKVVFLLLLGLVGILVWTVAGLGNQYEKIPALELSRKELWDVPGPAPVPWRYYGCFKNADRKVLRGLADFRDPSFPILSGRDTDSDVISCLVFCNGFKYAGLQDTDKCMCGNEFHGSFDTLRVGDEQCNLPCGETTISYYCESAGCPTQCGEKQCCGGNGTMDLYETTKAYETHARFVGCFARSDYWDVDANGQRIRPTEILTQRRNTDDLAALPADEVNVNTCAEFCKGYGFMGILSGQCSCGTTGELGSTVDRWYRGYCSLPCANDNATVDDCKVFGCSGQAILDDGRQACGGLSYGSFRFTSIYVLHSCTTLIQNASTARISAWVNETSNPVVCEDGFSLSGPEILHCNSSMIWEEPEMPTCN